jgi:radical SAM superfamily enzyme YgiQ (UPF0313 family)
MKILLLMPNYNYSGRYYISLGLMYVASYLKRLGYDVSCLNLNHYGPDKLAEELRRTRYDIVATGGLFTYYANFRALIKEIREISPHSKIVLGGAVASADPSFAAKSLGPDYLVIGEGENAMAQLVQNLQSGLDVEQVPGIGLMSNGKFVQTPAQAALDIETIPWPDYDGFEYARYLDEFAFSFDQTSHSPFPVRRIAQIISGRGCVAACTFCFRLIPHYRLRSISSVLAEIRHLQERYGINEIVIVDDLFSNTKERIYEFCRGIKALGIAWTCQVRIPVVTQDVLSAMKDSGCIQVSYGLESASAKVLRSMRKGITIERMEEALSLTHKAKMTIQGNFIFGDPAETSETIEETLTFFRKHQDTFSSSINLATIIPYPGSILYENLIQKGKIRDRERFARTYKDEHGQYINMTTMSDRDFQRLVHRVIPREQKRVRTFGKVRQSVQSRPNFYVVSYVCPFCREQSDNLEMAIDPANPIFSFRVVCAHCFQRSFVREWELLGLWHTVIFFGKTGLARLWEGIKTSRLFSLIRYNRHIDQAWEFYKEELAQQRLKDRSRLGFLELSAGSALIVRGRFALRLLRQILERMLPGTRPVDRNK